MPSKSLACILIIALSSSCTFMEPVAQRPPTNEQIFIYYHDELLASLRPGSPVNPNIHPKLVELRRDDDLFDPCLPAPSGASLSPVLVPLALFGFKLFASVLEADLAAREKRRIAALSKSYSQLRSDSAFPSTTGAAGRPRCLIVDRVGWTGDAFTHGATYVFGLKAVGQTAFTVEPVAARVDSTPVAAGQREQTVNANVSLAFQSIQPNRHLERNDLTTLPAYSVTFEKLTIGKGAEKKGGQHKSPVLPISSLGSPTTVAAAITESHTSLASEKERVALEQANRAALFAAIGEAIKTALTD